MKPELVLQPDQFSSFTSYYLESLWRRYFDIKIYDPTQNYSKKTLFVFWWMNAHDPVVNELHSQGHKIVIDNLWEVPDKNSNQYYQLFNPNWVWWNESLWWRSLGYNQYRPNRTYKKTALMQIGRVSDIRDWIVDHLGPLKDQMIWSYKDQRLPNDDYIGQDVNQRFMNPQWYDNTCINLVVETRQHGKIYWATEKTFKACAYYQPMLIIGQTETLQWLKQHGFETFDNLFDESYDQEPVFEKRFDMILQNLQNIGHDPYSVETQQKLEHNHHHFFDETKAIQGIVTEIIEPLLHYAET